MARIGLGAIGLGVLAAALGCEQGSGGGRGAATAPITSATSGGPTATAAGGVDAGALVAAYEQRRQDYLAHGATGGSYYSQLSRLELGLAVDRAPLDAMLDFIASRKDTSDFKTTALLRILYLHEQNPLLPRDWVDRAKRELLAFRYWLDEPGRDSMCFWSENHQLMFAASEYLAGQRWPNETFTNDGRTGAEHMADARPRLLRWLNARLRYGYSEWYSPVYYPHDVSPLLNLIDFAQDAELQRRAAMALDLLLFDLARLTHRGSFGVTAGRAYEEHKWSGRNQSVGDLIEVLFGTRGEFHDRASTAATPLVTSPGYRVPHVLLAIGVDKGKRFVDRARVSTSFAEAPAEGIGFASLEDGVFWWGMGAYMTPETIRLTRRMLDAYDLWDNAAFAIMRPLRPVPEALLPALSGTLSPISRGSVLSTARTYTFRNAAAQLSSVIDYRAGQVGFQQHAWQATLDLDACVWTTAPGLAGRDGPGTWTGSSSLPQVTQVEDVALILYNPGLLQRVVFSPETHAWFPKAAFDEVRSSGLWTFARKGEGYVALLSAGPTVWTIGGPWADKELRAGGYRNVWICQVGCADEDGTFDAFVQAIEQAPVQLVGAGNGSHDDPLSVSYQAPGLGRFEAAWGRPATLDGQPVHAQAFPRFDNPYAQQDWGDPVLEVRHAGLRLRHDRVAGTRVGEGM